jgi:uncharacterized membrane protein
MIRRSTVFASLLFAGAGTMHFVRPDFFESIVPDWFPSRRLANYGSGAAEIALGIGLLPPQTRGRSALGLAALTLAVFPANIDMAVNDVELKPVEGKMTRSVGTAAGIGRAVNWLRLPMQLPLVVWMVREALAAPRRRATITA